MSSRWAGIRDVGKWATPNVTVKSLMVMDSSGVVRQFKPGDNLPQCIIDAIGNIGGGSGGGGGSGTPQTLSITSPATGLSNQLLQISGGNTVTIRTPLESSALVPASASVGAVSTTILGAPDRTLGRPAQWIRIAGTNLVIPAYTGV